MPAGPVRHIFPFKLLDGHRHSVAAGIAQGCGIRFSRVGLLEWEFVDAVKLLNFSDLSGFFGASAGCCLPATSFIISFDPGKGVTTSTASLEPPRDRESSLVFPPQKHGAQQALDRTGLDNAIFMC